MTREEVKALLPIMQAFAEDKEIEGIYKGIKEPWFNVEDMIFDGGTIYRIKPSPKYRPFKDAEECWQEMQKHQPFGWIKDKEDNHYITITRIDGDEDRMAIGTKEGWNFEGIYRFFTFADDTPFGIEE